MTTIRPAYSKWPKVNRRLRDVVAAMTDVIVESCLDRWTLEMLAEDIRHPEWGGSWAHTRGFAIGAHGLPQVDLWG